MPSPFLSMLLGNQAAGILAGQDPQAQAQQPVDPAAVTVGNDIDVVGQPIDAPDPLAPRPYEDFSIDNARAVDIVRDADANTQDAAQRKGMFGVKGTLRDILGAVGDAFLVQSGNKAVYQPKRQQERESDAMAGFTENPLAAAERMAGHNAEAGAAIHDSYLLNQDRRQDNVRAGQQQAMDQEKLRLSTLGDARDLASRILSAASQSDDPTSSYPQAMEQIKSIAERMGLKMEDLSLREDMTTQELGMYATAGMTPYQQQRVPQYSRGLDISQQRANNTAANNRTRAQISREAEAGRNTRAAETLKERRERQRDEDNRGDGPRQLRGSTGSSSNKPRFGRPRGN